MRSPSVILLMIALVILSCTTDSVFLRKAATPYVNPVVRVSLSGYVTDNINSQPVPDATVFIKGTTHITQTNDVGLFTLNNVPLGAYEIGIYKPGVRPYFRRMRLTNDNNQDIIFKVPAEMLNPEPVIDNPGKTITQLKNEITELEQQIARCQEQLTAYKIFGDVVLGNPITCRLLNPEALKSETRTTFNKKQITYTAPAPLIIENLDLGYRIHLVVDKITLESNLDRYNMNFEGATQFFEMTPEDKDQATRWRNNRIEAYNGSLQHFLSALATHRLSEEGFMVSTRRDSESRITASGITGSWQTESEFIPRQDPYFIIYGTDIPYEYDLYLEDFIQVTYLKERPTDKVKYFPGISEVDQISMLSFPDGSVRFNSQGIRVDYKRLMISGYWGVQQICDMLPKTFVPE